MIILTVTFVTMWLHSDMTSVNCAITEAVPIMLSRFTQRKVRLLKIIQIVCPRIYFLKGCSDFDNFLFVWKVLESVMVSYKFHEVLKIACLSVWLFSFFFFFFPIANFNMFLKQTVLFYVLTNSRHTVYSFFFPLQRNVNIA